MKYHIVRCLVYFLLFSFLSLNVAMALDGGDVITTSITEVPYCDSRCSRGLAFKFSFSEGSSIVSESIGTLTDGTEYSRELDIDFQENVILCESIDTNIDSMYRVIGIVGSRRISIYLIQKGVVPSDFIISDIKFISTGNTGNLYVSYDTQAYYTVTGENQMASYDATLCDDLECKININSLSVSGTREVGTDLTFVVDADNSCSRTIYYRFSVHPGYGTDDYDGLSWTGMTTEEYVTSSTCTYAFDETGQYIVVVWAKDNIADDNTGVKIAGIEVEISEEGQEPYFPFQ